MRGACRDSCVVLYGRRFVVGGGMPGTHMSTQACRQIWVVVWHCQCDTMSMYTCTAPHSSIQNCIHPHFHPPTYLPALYLECCHCRFSHKCRQIRPTEPLTRPTPPHRLQVHIPPQWRGSCECLQDGHPPGRSGERDVENLVQSAWA